MRSTLHPTKGKQGIQNINTKLPMQIVSLDNNSAIINNQITRHASVSGCLNYEVEEIPLS